MNVFSTVDSWVDSKMEGAIELLTTSLANDISLILTSSITLYVIFYGYLTLAGKIQEPVRDLVWNLAKFAFILAFINNTGGYLTLALNGVKGLSSLGTGGTHSGLGFLDLFYAENAETIKAVASKSGKFIGVFYGAVMFIGLLLGTIPAALLIITNKIVMFFLLGLAPLFLFALMWGWLKESFGQYLGAILSNALVIVVVTSVMKHVIELFSQITFVGHGRVDGQIIAGTYLIMGIFSSAIITFLAEKANGLMRVSIESIPSSAPKDTDHGQQYSIADPRRFTGASRLLKRVLNGGKKNLEKEKK